MTNTTQKLQKGLLLLMFSPFCSLPLVSFEKLLLGLMTILRFLYLPCMDVLFTGPLLSMLFYYTLSSCSGDRHTHTQEAQ